MLTRIITGIIGIALMAVIIDVGGKIFAAFALLASLVAWHEYADAFSHKGIRTSYALGMVALILMWGCAWLGNGEEFIAVSTGTMMLVLLLPVFFYGRFSVKDACVSLAGIFYIGLAFAHIVLLRLGSGGHSAMAAGAEAGTIALATPLGDMEYGAVLIWIMFIGTWASDTFAYFTGSFLGQHKLCPNISPKKTVEGFLGGLLGTMAAEAGLGVFFGFSPLYMAGLGAAIAIVATLGDLVESVVKRYTGIKDSGSLIPGHGGVLDRFDSVMFTAPFVYYFTLIVNFLGGGAP